MPSFRQLTIVLLIALTLSSCRRDPATAKKQYLESGNSYLDKGRFKEAVIQYQNAIKIDPKYGPAHYKLAVVYLKVKPPAVSLAIKEYRKSIELLKDNQAYQEEYKQSLVQLSDILLTLAYRDNKSMGDVEDQGGYLSELARKDPNSFDLYRLTGDLAYKRGGLALETGDQIAAAAQFDKAMENYRKAIAIKPNDTGVSMQIGLILGVQKHFAEAEPYLRKAIDNDKTFYAGYMALYRLYMVEQKTSDAEQLLKEAIRNNPKSHEFLERLAYHYGALGRRDDMLNVLEQIKSHAKDFDAVYQVVGDFYLRTGDADSALREYREGMVKDPKRKAAYQHAVIYVLLRQGKRAEAAEVNGQILKENPKDADAKSLEASFLLDRGDVNNALTQLQALVTSSPDNAVAHYQLGRAYMASGKADARESARQQFERAISLRQDMVQPRLGLAELQVMHGEYQAAMDSVQEILKRDPGNSSARIIESQALLGMKKYGESDNLLAGMLKANPSSPDVFYQAGLSAMSQGKLKEAEGDFMRAYQLNPANAKGLLGVVEADIQQGKPQEAMAVLQAESRKAPNRLDIPLLMGTTAKSEGKYSEALESFNKVLNGLDKKAALRADLYLQIADTYRLAGDRDAAIANIQKARELKPDNETVLADLGQVMDQAGKKAEARQAYEACLRVNPNNAVILNNLAFLLAENNSDQLDMALNYVQRARQLQPHSDEISDTYGWVLLKKGLPDQAIPVFKDLVTRIPGESTYHFHLAKAYSQKTEYSKEGDELREALKHSPPKDEQQEIQEMLAKVGGK